MNIIDRGIGICMVITGGELFIFAHMIEPYMGPLSGVTSYAIAISAAILLAGPCAALIGFGMAQAIGLISIGAAVE